MFKIGQIFKKIGFYFLSICFIMDASLVAMGGNSQSSSSSSSSTSVTVSPLGNNSGTCFANAGLQLLFRCDSFLKKLDEVVKSDKTQQCPLWNHLALIKQEWDKLFLLRQNKVQTTLPTANNLVSDLFKNNCLKGATNSRTFLISLLDALVFELDGSNVKSSFFYTYEGATGKLSRAIVGTFGPWLATDLVYQFPKNNQSELNFDMDIIVSPSLGLIMVTPILLSIKNEVLEEEFKSRIHNLLAKICQDYQVKIKLQIQSPNINFALKGVEAILIGSRGGHDIAYVKSSADGKWYLCNDELIFDLGGRCVINHIYEDLLTPFWLNALGRGNFDVVSMRALLFEITDNHFDDIDFTTSKTSSSFSSSSSSSSSYSSQQVLDSYITNQILQSFGDESVLAKKMKKILREFILKMKTKTMLVSLNPVARQK